MDAQVRIPKGFEPRFPNYCAGCGRRFSTEQLNRVAAQLQQSKGCPVQLVRQIELPFCQSCQRRLRPPLWQVAAIGLLGGFVACIVGVLLVLWLAPQLGRPGFAIAGFLLCIPVLKLLSPLTKLKLTIYAVEEPNHISFRFRDRKLANEFAQINNREVEVQDRMTR